MFDVSQIPSSIASKIMGLPWRYDTMGMSGSTILLFDKMVLKIEKDEDSARCERALLSWLYGRLPVPKVLAAETHGGYSFLLTTKLPGEMACSDTNLRQMDALVNALAEGLKMLWSVDIAGCPFSNAVDEKLREARYRIDHHLIDTGDFEQETLNADGFTGVEHLFRYLSQNRPKQDLVFSHGDYCLPNIFVADGNITGFLDWGRGGVADRWQDIALCVRSLKYNHMEYAGYTEADYQKYKALLFQELGMQPDEEKIRYYILLDELF